MRVSMILPALTEATSPFFRPIRYWHPTYAGGWKKFEPLWDLLIRTGRVTRALPLLESLLGSFGARPAGGRLSRRAGLRRPTGLSRRAERT
jgi:hypothetical protein